MTASPRVQNPGSTNAAVAVGIEVVPANNPTRWRHALEIRRTVFQDEQGLVDVDLADVEDNHSLTVVGYLDGRPVSTGRLSRPSVSGPGQLTWIATLPAFRGQGMGSAVVRFLVQAADERGYGELQLSAQAHAIQLYERYGFVPHGALYVVRDIQHQTMIRLATHPDAGLLT